MAFLLNEFLVGFKMAWYRQWLGTFFTCKWLISTMSSYVSTKITRLLKWLRTFFANKCLLSGMSSHLALKAAWLENDSEHSLQVNDFSPEWVLWWVLRLIDTENWWCTSETVWQCAWWYDIMTLWWRIK